MKFLPLVLILFSFTLHAERIQTRIHSIDHELVLFENGRVGFTTPGEKSLPLTNDWLDVELDHKNNILGASAIPAPKLLTELNDPDPQPESDSYTPGDVGTIEQATSIFRKMARAQSRSQCYNRAHIWTYEEWKRSGLRSMKLFMFFTRSYIRAYRYKWWFHVTPMTYVNGTPMTLDRTFMRSPVSIKSWTDNFIYSKRNCPVIYKYTDYSQHQEEEHCYLHPASMYYWQPRDLENREKYGTLKTQFIKSEVNWAYYEAF